MIGAAGCAHRKVKEMCQGFRFIGDLEAWSVGLMLEVKLWYAQAN